jgi:acyl-CoA synthetase (NDP forming)
VALLTPGGNISEAGLSGLHRSGIPRFRAPSKCVRALRHLCDYADFQREREQRGRAAWKPLRYQGTARQFRAGMLGPYEAQDLLKRYGLPLARQELATGVEGVAGAAARIGYPVALKAIAPNLVHKTEAGGVALGLRDADDVAKAYEDMQVRIGTGTVLVQEMVEGGVEMIVGLHRDPQFGPTVVVGMGGVLVELLGDRVLGLPPLDRAQVHSMLEGLRGKRLLEGFRGRDAADLDALVDVVLSVSRLGEELGDRVTSIDLNPVIVLPTGRGARVVDARVIWGAG